MTFLTVKKPSLISAAVILLVLTICSASIIQIARADQQASPDLSDDSGTAPENPNLTISVFVPFLLADHPWERPFATESSLPMLASNTLLTRTLELPVGFVRLGNQISWRNLQPNPGDKPRWDLLATFEDELRGLKAAGIRPVVVIKDSPEWALDREKARDADGNLTSCGAIDEDYFDDFAAFIYQLVVRYKTPEFNVLDWELGNEPDVDPTLVPQNYMFGCWGDEDDPFYGGEHYGRMLKAVAPVIRQADSRAKIWIGGLLLASPSSNLDMSMSELYTRGILEAGTGSQLDTDQISGSPELFFEGILESGAAPYFDVVPYHWYATYWDGESGPFHDYDIAGNSPWYTWGGGVIGKARFLRQAMDQFNVDKPVVLNESGFGCSEKASYCEPPPPRFFDSQATHLVRFFVRGLSEGVSGFVWYTLNGPSWRNVGLLDGANQPRLAYNAYQQLSGILHFARYLYPVGEYSPFIEAYAFRINSEQVHVLWSKEDEIVSFRVPVNKFIRAVDRDGLIIYDQSQPPPQIGLDYLLEVGFRPIYLVRYP